MYGYRAWIGVMILAAWTGCGPGSDPDSFFPPPAGFAPLLVRPPCAACGILTTVEMEPGNRLIVWGVRHPELGGTFHVNIDHDRRVVKLRPVRDPRETLVLYDPYHHASGHETGSRYIQARSAGGCNRFELAVGFVYAPGASPDAYSQFILAGKATLDEEERVLFTDGG